MDEVRDTFPALFWGYTALWTLLCIYLVYLGAKLSNLEKKFCSKADSKSNQSESN